MLGFRGNRLDHKRHNKGVRVEFYSLELKESCKRPTDVLVDRR